MTGAEAERLLERLTREEVQSWPVPLDQLSDSEIDSLSNTLSGGIMARIDALDLSTDDQRELLAASIAWLMQVGAESPGDLIARLTRFMDP